jgi:hypothetical protein
MVLIPVLCPHCQSDQVIKGGTPDPRLRVIATSAETIDEVVRKEGWSRGDGVVASGHAPFVCPHLSPFDSAGNARNVIFHEERIHYRDGYRAQ